MAAHHVAARGAAGADDRLGHPPRRGELAAPPPRRWASCASPTSGWGCSTAAGGGEGGRASLPRARAARRAGADADRAQAAAAARARAPAGRRSTASREAVALVDDLIARVRKMSVDLRPPLLDEVGLVPALRAYLEAQSGAVGRRDGAGGGHGEDAAAPGRAPAVRSGDRLLPRRAGVDHQRAPPRVRPARQRPHRAAAPPASRCRSRTTAAGFDVGGTLETAAAEGHLGVVGMRERVRAHGGMFQVISHPGIGTTVTVDLPFKSNKELKGSGAAMR